jgi:Ribosomal protein S7
VKIMFGACIIFNIYSLFSVQVPVPIPESRSQFMAMKWIILAAKEKDPKVHFPEKLAWELLDAAANQVCSHCHVPFANNIPYKKVTFHAVLLDL